VLVTTAASAAITLSIYFAAEAGMLPVRQWVYGDTPHYSGASIKR